MAVTVIAEAEKSVTLQVTIPLTGSMLEREAAIQQALNDAGALATGYALAGFDTDGSPIVLGDFKWTSKGRFPEIYQTPYGPTEVVRHRYQTSQGGRSFCPMEQAARIILTATPRFARMLSHKYAEFGAGRVTEDLVETLGFTVTRAFIQNVADAVGAAIQVKEETWSYATPALDAVIPTISIGLDGTCILMVEEGGREAMVGTIALYDTAGDRQHTIYIAAHPEHGRATFLERLDREVAHVKRLYPGARCLGLADGAKGNWEFLDPRTDDQLLDFFHVTEYLHDAAEEHFPTAAERTTWVDTACHRLKHDNGAALALLAELRTWPEPLRAESKPKAPGAEGTPTALGAAVTYFTNNHPRMAYAAHVAAGHPIGSGVTEAGCKVIVKQRLCASSMQWKERGAGIVLSLRSLSYSTGRWDQFWAKVDRYGFPVAL